MVCFLMVDDMPCGQSVLRTAKEGQAVIAVASKIEKNAVYRIHR
jgi:hypothetical protein